MSFSCPMPSARARFVHRLPAGLCVFAASLLLASCESDPATVKPELVAGRTFNVTRVDGQALPLVIQRMSGLRAPVCEAAPLLRSTLKFNVDGILEQAVWSAQDARASIFLMTYTQLENGTIHVGDSEAGTVSGGIFTLRVRTPFVCTSYTWEASETAS